MEIRFNPFGRKGIPEQTPKNEPFVAKKLREFRNRIRFSPDAIPAVQPETLPTADFLARKADFEHVLTMPYASDPEKNAAQAAFEAAGGDDPILQKRWELHKKEVWDGTALSTKEQKIKEDLALQTEDRLHSHAPDNADETIAVLVNKWSGQSARMRNEEADDDARGTLVRGMERRRSKKALRDQMAAMLTGVGVSLVAREAIALPLTVVAALPSGAVSGLAGYGASRLLLASERAGWGRKGVAQSAFMLEQRYHDFDTGGGNRLKRMGVGTLKNTGRRFESMLINRAINPEGYSRSLATNNDIVDAYSAENGYTPGGVTTPDAVLTYLTGPDAPADTDALVTSLVKEAAGRKTMAVLEGINLAPVAPGTDPTTLTLEQSESLRIQALENAITEVIDAHYVTPEQRRDVLAAARQASEEWEADLYKQYTRAIAFGTGIKSAVVGFAAAEVVNLLHDHLPLRASAPTKESALKLGNVDVSSPTSAPTDTVTSPAPTDTVLPIPTGVPTPEPTVFPPFSIAGPGKGPGLPIDVHGAHKTIDVAINGHKVKFDVTVDNQGHVKNINEVLKHYGIQVAGHERVVLNQVLTRHGNSGALLKLNGVPSTESVSHLAVEPDGTVGQAIVDEAHMAVPWNDAHFWQSLGVANKNNASLWLNAEKIAHGVLNDPNSYSNPALRANAEHVINALHNAGLDKHGHLANPQALVNSDAFGLVYAGQNLNMPDAYGVHLASVAKIVAEHQKATGGSGAVATVHEQTHATNYVTQLEHNPVSNLYIKEYQAAHPGTSYKDAFESIYGVRPGGMTTQQIENAIGLNTPAAEIKQAFYDIVYNKKPLSEQNLQLLQLAFDRAKFSGDAHITAIFKAAGYHKGEFTNLQYFNTHQQELNQLAQWLANQEQQGGSALKIARAS